MAIGDGIRRNVAAITSAERDRLRNAILAIDRVRLFPDGVSYWDKQDQIHQATHVHGGPSFLPWHRELCNRFEAMLRDVDSELSLHYWDWTVDPRSAPDGTGGFVNLMSANFMGAPSGRAGAPFETFDNGGVFVGSRDQTGNPANPPQSIERDLSAGAPGVPADAAIISASDGFPEEEQFSEFADALEGAHNTVHGYIGGNIGFGHTAFEDPFVFLLHSNVDRLFALWQQVPRAAWRLDPNQVYGLLGSTTGSKGIMTPIEPWAAIAPNKIRPWGPPENESVNKNCKDTTVVAPPKYA